MNIVADNEFTQMLNRTGKALPKPKAIVVVSAHWLTNGTFIATAKNPETIYDFGGFPNELYQIKYAAQGSPDLAKQIMSQIKNPELKPDSKMGFDHGAWSVLHHLYPEANIPVVQLSIDYHQTGEHHFQIGKAIEFLRDEEVLVIGSGNIVHNLRAIDFQNENAVPYDWAVEFDEVVKNKILERNFSPLNDYKSFGQIAQYSVPTPDHYFPLLYILGMTNSSDKIEFLFDGFQNKSISMRAVQFS